jgi:hypothetical protein
MVRRRWLGVTTEHRVRLFGPVLFSPLFVLMGGPQDPPEQNMEVLKGCSVFGPSRSRVKHHSRLGPIRGMFGECSVGFWAGGWGPARPRRPRCSVRLSRLALPLGVGYGPLGCGTVAGRIAA